MFSEFIIPFDSGFYTFPNDNIGLKLEDGLGNPAPKLAEHEYTLAHGSAFLSQFYKPAVWHWAVIVKETMQVSLRQPGVHWRFAWPLKTQRS